MTLQLLNLLYPEPGVFFGPEIKGVWGAFFENETPPSSVECPDLKNATTFEIVALVFLHVVSGSAVRDGIFEVLMTS